MNSFENKVAAITGAGSGIGRALALGLARKGCHLALSDVDKSGLEETQLQLQKFSITVTAQVLDVSEKDSVYAWADQVVKDHGKVNMIFNNAGVALSGTTQTLSLEDYEWIMNINFWGVMYGTKAFLPYLEQSGEGHIVNISSVFGILSQPLMGGYNASKFAVRGYTESLRQDLEMARSNVSATCIHPGGIKTNIAKSARMSNEIKDVTGSSGQELMADFERFFITTPDTAAETILRGVAKNKRRVLIGKDARVLDLLARLFPTGYQKVMTRVFQS